MVIHIFRRKDGSYFADLNAQHARASGRIVDRVKILREADAQAVIDNPTMKYGLSVSRRIKALAERILRIHFGVVNRPKLSRWQRFKAWLKSKL